GVVGGQTICGLRQLAMLIEATQRSAAAEDTGLSLCCWPHDGLDLESDAYRDAHVLLEIYPAMHRPANIPRSDAADAEWAARGLQAIAERMQFGTGSSAPLSREAIMNALQRAGIEVPDMATEIDAVIRLEGWIAGMGSPDQ
ncbi:MAG: hypothetical protein ACOC0P_03050, partial [Planctomycetota bacterium]